MIDLHSDEMLLTCRHCKQGMRLLDIESDLPCFEAVNTGRNCPDAPDHEPDLNSIRLLLTARPIGCEDCDGNGWRIDQVDGDPGPGRTLGVDMIARCDSCTIGLIADDDAELIPEAQAALARRDALPPAHKQISTVNADNHNPVRTVVATVMITTDADVAEVARVVRDVLNKADAFSYHLSVAEVIS